MDDGNDPKGAHSRAPIFKGENYAYQKENMYAHLLPVDKTQWVDVIERPFTLKGNGDNVKHPTNWIDNETKPASYDLKASNIIISVLSVKRFHSISHHKSVKGM